MFVIRVIANNAEVSHTYYKPIRVSDVFKDVGFSIDMQCGGKGTCGKCTVRVNDRMVLACQTILEQDAVIFLDTNIDTLQTVAAKDVQRVHPIADAGYGLAVDIGTTTVCAVLYKLETGERLNEVTVRNEQRSFGADVISRIDYAMHHGVAQLSDIIHRQIDMIRQGFGLPISAQVVCGNTTMLHLFSGIDPSSMGTAPFTPQELFGRFLDQIYLPHCISAFVGADITCAIIASDMLTRQETALLVDIGTNGEMALIQEGKLVCTSTAAGPAFEGAMIHMGMLSVDGAINTVRLQNGQVTFTTIGGQPETGICGSGLIDAIAVFRQLEAISETGAIVPSPYSGTYEGKPCLKLGNVIITAKDVRQVQLAKSAIRSGIDVLLQECGVEDIDRFYIAGGFGSYLNLDSAAQIGLIPQAFVDKTSILGNAALTGASALLLNQELMQTSKKIAQSAEVIDLATSAAFMDRYIENMMF